MLDEIRKTIRHIPFGFSIEPAGSGEAIPVPHLDRNFRARTNVVSEDDKEVVDALSASRMTQIPYRELEPTA